MNNCQLVSKQASRVGHRCPSLGIGPLLDSRKTDIQAILLESMEPEAKVPAPYKELHAAVEGKSVALEECARQMIYAEEVHASQVDKVLRRPGAVETAVTKGA